MTNSLIGLSFVYIVFGVEKMPVRCAAIWCNYTKIKDDDISFFSFPRDTKRNKHWIVYCGRRANDFKEQSKKAKLCSKHFSREQYARDPQWFVQFGYDKTNPRLKDDAVPDIPLDKEEAQTVNTVLSDTNSTLFSLYI